MGYLEFIAVAIVSIVAWKMMGTTTNILNAAQVTRKMTDGSYGKQPTCSRCFGFNDSGGPFCSKCETFLRSSGGPLQPYEQNIPNIQDTNAKSLDLEAAAGLALEFPWVLDVNGIARMLTKDEICSKCGKAQGLWSGGSYFGLYCTPCRDEWVKGQAPAMMNQVDPQFVSALKMADVDPRSDFYVAMPSPTMATTMSFYAWNKELVKLKPDGTVEFSPGYTPDTAAKEFWEAMARNQPGVQPPKAPAETERNITFED